MNTILIVCVVAFCTIQSISCDGDDEKILVKVEQGVLQGAMQDSEVSEKPFYAFKNIPYAKPPVGDLRFKAPEQPESWNGTRDATEYGPMCPQYDQLTNQYTKGSENCLTLNVFSPNIYKKCKLPVVVLFSSAAFSFDYSKDLYGPDYMIADEMVVVTFNFRLGVLGFLNLGTAEVPGNAGLKDQVAVLRWVKKNIRKFGGDPNDVTLIGHSSGSAAIGYHLASPMSKGLFRRAILQTGVPNCDPILPYKVEEKSYLLAKTLGIDTENKAELLTKLQSVPHEEMVYQKCALLTSEEINNVLFKKMTQFLPDVEKDFGQERFLVQDPLEAFLSGNVNKVDVMIGFERHEALLVVDDYAKYIVNLYDRYRELAATNKILYHTTPDVYMRLANKIINFYFGNKTISVDNMNEFIKMTSDSSLGYDELKFADLCSSVLPTYLFKFNSRSELNFYGKEGEKYGVFGTSHGDSIFYTWHLPTVNLVNGTTEYKMTKQFVNAQTNFAKYGNPTPNAESGNTWPKYTPDTKIYAEFTDTITIKSNPGSEEVAFWDSIYEEANLPYPYWPNRHYEDKRCSQ